MLEAFKVQDFQVLKILWYDFWGLERMHWNLDCKFKTITKSL